MSSPVVPLIIISAIVGFNSLVIASTDEPEEITVDELAPAQKEEAFCSSTDHPEPVPCDEFEDATGVDPCNPSVGDFLANFSVQCIWKTVNGWFNGEGALGIIFGDGGLLGMLGKIITSIYRGATFDFPNTPGVLRAVFTTGLSVAAIWPVAQLIRGTG